MIEKIKHDFALIYSGAGNSILSSEQQNYELLDRTFSYAANRHSGQLRKGPLKRPYTDHVLMTWDLVRLLGGGLVAQQAALLHDVVEDCRKPGESRASVLEEIKGEFSESVSHVVSDLTLPFDDENDEEELTIIGNLVGDPKLIRGCDTTANLWDAVYDIPEHWTAERYDYILSFRENVSGMLNEEGSVLGILTNELLTHARTNTMKKFNPRLNN